MFALGDVCLGVSAQRGCLPGGCLPGRCLSREVSGVHSKGRCANLLFGQISPNFCMKTRNFGPRGMRSHPELGLLTTKMSPAVQ